MRMGKELREVGSKNKENTLEIVHCMHLFRTILLALKEGQVLEENRQLIKGMVWKVTESWGEMKEV